MFTAVEFIEVSQLFGTCFGDSDNYNCRWQDLVLASVVAAVSLRKSNRLVDGRGIRWQPPRCCFLKQRRRFRCTADKGSGELQAITPMTLQREIVKGLGLATVRPAYRQNYRIDDDVAPKRQQ